MFRSLTYLALASTMKKPQMGHAAPSIVAIYSAL
jgi:hypothetical protein